MDNLFYFLGALYKTVLSIGPFLILLGVLIFIHELGHFLAAIYFGVKVEVFSLGFGPKIFKYKRGDTVYCISLLPLGGYVKMFGDNPIEEIPNTEKSRGFLYKKVPEKWIIAFAGPFMNLIFTVLVFFILSWTGLPSVPSQVGDIKKDSTAYKVGFRSGDSILSVNGKKVSYIEDVNKIIKKSIGETLVFEVKSENDKIKFLSAPVSEAKNTSPLEWKKTIGHIEGLSFLSKGPRVGVIYNSPAYRVGIRTFDIIKEANNKKIRYWRELETLIKNTKGQDLSLTVERESEVKSFMIKNTGSLLSLGIEESYLYIQTVGPDTPASRAGLLKGDRLVAINGKPLTSWEQVLNSIKTFDSGADFSLVYMREGTKKEISISPRLLFVEGNLKKRLMLGIGSGRMDLLPEETLRKRSAFQSVIYSGQESLKWLSAISIGLIRLIQGEFSLRTVGGPVLIGRIAHKSFIQGLKSFLYMMALISLNLFFLNLLPIPVLDGGHLLFFTIEGILGRPLSVKKLIVAQQMGLLFLLSFMGFAVFNDIYNWIKAW